MGRSWRPRLSAGTLAAALLVACWEPRPPDPPAPQAPAAQPRSARAPDAAEFRASAAKLLERSRRIRDAARPDYQREALAALPPSPLNGPTARLDDLLPTARPVRAAPDVAGGGDGTLFGFEFRDGEAPGFRSSGSATRIALRDGLLRVENDPGAHLVADRELPAFDEAIGEIVIRMRCDAGRRLVLSWGVASPGEALDPGAQAPWHHQVDANVIADGEFHTYVIDAKTSIAPDLRPGDRIATLWLRPSDVRGATVEIDYVRFVSRYARYAQQPRGVGHDSLGGVWRSVLYMLPTQALEYSLRIPEHAPQLEFGAGVLYDAAPVTFEVSVAEGDQEQRIHAAEVADSAGWRDSRIDLAPWAGRRVRLTLRVSAEARNVAFWSNPVVGSARVRPFHVVLLLEDALRADRLSTQGYGAETSPHKTAFMASEGVLFQYAFSQATKTRPSVPALMTSLLPTATGVWNFADTLDDAFLTLAEILRSQGFATAAFLQNANAGPMAGLHQGFDEIRERALLGDEPEGVLGDPVFAWLAAHADRNFLLYLHVLDPHGPYDPPPPFDAAYRALGPGGEPVERDSEFDPEAIPAPTAAGRSARYDGEIRRNDSLLPALIARLDELGLRENTLLLMTSDHGEFLGERGLWGHRPPGLSQVTHVPLMLSYPARFPGGRVIPHTVQLIDVLPTVLELAGIDPTGLLLYGDSLVGLIEGEAPGAWEDRVAVSEEPLTFDPSAPTATGSFFFRRWHLISSRTFSEHPQSRRSGMPERRRIATFDFRRDPAETTPLGANPPGLEEAYLATMRELQANNAVAHARWTARTGEAVHRTDPEEVERLRELGYMR